MRFALFFIDRPVFASAISIVTVIVGIISMFSLPISQYPEIAPPTVIVSASYPGANAKTVAETVATPIEEQINGVEGMLYMSSQSTNDGSMKLTVTFKLGTNLDIAQVQVQNRATIAQPQLPAEVVRAGVVVKKSSPSITLGMAIYSPDGSRDLLYLSNYTTLQIRDELSRLEGVGDLQLFGVRDYSMRLWLNPNQMASRNITTGDFITAIKKRVTELIGAESPSYGRVVVRGKTVFAMKQQPPKQQSYLVRLPSLDAGAVETTLLDPNVIDPTGKTAIDFFVPSHDGKLVAVSLSQGGSENGDVHIYEVATGKERTSDVVPRVNGGTAGGSLAWSGAGFFYTRYPHDGERPPVDMGFYQQVYFHKLGTPTSADTYAIGKDFPRIGEVELEASEDGKLALARIENGDGGQYEIHLRGPSGKWSQLSTYADKVVDAKFGPDGALYLLSHAAQHGQILRLFPATQPLAKATVLVPESEGVIASFVPTATRLYVTDLVGGPSQVRIAALPGVHASKKAEPAATLPILPVSHVSFVERLSGDDVAFRNESYVEPAAWYRFSAADGKVTRTPLFKKSPADMSDAEVVRESCTSKDGTKVPISLVQKHGAPRDGSGFAMLTGYGGYSVSRSPRFRALIRMLIDQGGVYAEANLRGGGEFGEQWHEQGSLTKKQNVFDDFHACAQLLVDEKITTPARLAIQGASNGGLLMGAELVQHPEMFRVVVSHVGIYDMLHVEDTPNGAFNVTEFGTVKDEAQFKALYAYSPLHHVADGTAYPAILFLTGANDPRVDPYNSRKMTARLQAAVAGLPSGASRSVLLRTSHDTGHGWVRRWAPRSRKMLTSTPSCSRSSGSPSGHRELQACSPLQSRLRRRHELPRALRARELRPISASGSSRATHPDRRRATRLSERLLAYVTPELPEI